MNHALAGNDRQQQTQAMESQDVSRALEIPAMLCQLDRALLVQQEMMQALASRVTPALITKPEGKSDLPATPRQCGSELGQALAISTRRIEDTTDVMRRLLDQLQL